MRQDRVLTINDYYDGPRLGIAELNGVPYIYEAQFDHSAEEYGDTYLLSPASDELLALVLEDWAIWLRWNAAYKRGEVTVESHPALPEDRARYGQLQEAIGDRLRTDPNTRVYLKAVFGRVKPEGEWDGTTVEWRTP